MSKNGKYGRKKALQRKGVFSHRSPFYMIEKPEYRPITISEEGDIKGYPNCMAGLSLTQFNNWRGGSR